MSEFQNSNLQIYYPANHPYWFFLYSKSIEEPILVKLNVSSLVNGMSVEMSPSELSNIGFINIDFSKNVKYKLYYDTDKIIIFQNKRHCLKFRRKNINYEDAIITSTDLNIIQFRNTTKENLIKSLSDSSNNNSIDGILKAFCDYTFFNGYSAWHYNEITNTFTRIAGNVYAKEDYIKNTNASFFQKLLNVDAQPINCMSNTSLLPENDSLDLPWMNCFLVSVKNPTTLTSNSNLKIIICLYSKCVDYNLRDETISTMKGFLKQAITDRYFDRILGLNDTRALIASSLKFGDPVEPLQVIAEHICKFLFWESCSIFLKDKRKEILNPVARYPKDTKILGDYDLNKESLTTTVFNEKLPQWSYDINSDSRNTHCIDDPTQSEPLNWIGAPIMSAEGKPVLGVLRVKNKMHAHNDIDKHFCNLDLKNIESVASELSYFLQQSAQYSDLNDFLRTLRHEIRSPLQVICLAPQRLRAILRYEQILISTKLNNYLDDFKVISDRLVMLSKSLTLTPKEFVKEIKWNNVYKDSIAPIIAFATPYASKRKRYIDVDKDSLLIDKLFDKDALSIAVHVLIDNAIKYSDEGTTINVYGQKIHNGFQIVVENSTKVFVIDKAEVHCLCDKYYRGKASISQKLEGSGIGLFLAREIMEAHNCSLIILSVDSPIKFALRLNY